MIVEDMMDLTLTNGRQVTIILDGFGRAHIEGEDETFLRFNPATGVIMADASLQEGQFVSIDKDGDFVVWRPPAKYAQN